MADKPTKKDSYLESDISVMKLFKLEWLDLKMLTHILKIIVSSPLLLENLIAFL
jgi:hypothetical protein